MSATRTVGSGLVKGKPRASVRRSLLFEQHLHPVWRLHLDDPVGSVLARPLHDHFEGEACLLAGGDDGINVAHAELPGQTERGRPVAGTATEPEPGLLWPTWVAVDGVTCRLQAGRSALNYRGLVVPAVSLRPAVAVRLVGAHRHLDLGEPAGRRWGSGGRGDTRRRDPGPVSELL
jgi:hypothetical protein